MSDARNSRESRSAGTRGFAPGAPLAELPATARAILEAARRILERDGYAGLTYEALSAESGEYKDSVRYHFGGKAGLIAAVVDSSVHDVSLEIYASARELESPEDRLGAVIAASRDLPTAEGAWTLWELLPQVLRQEELRTRLAELYDWYREHYLELFAVDDPRRTAIARDFATILLAVLDGLAMQKALDPDGVDLDSVFRLWRRIVTSSLEAAMEPDGEAAG